MIMRPRSRFPVWGLLLLALLLPWVSGCDQDALNPPEPSNDLFRSYVAIGNSITAGFQSGGINESTQQESYAVLLAEQMETPFNIPVLSDPGCPPPLAQAFPPQRISSEECALRSSLSPPTLNNVAVPEARVVDVLTNLSPTSNPNPLTSFILGGQTQIEMAKRANPTFVSAWIGNNDVLGAALAGDATLATSPETFQTRYAGMVSELDSISTLEGAVFVGVADVTFIPHLSRGAAYNQAIPAGQDAGAVPPNFKLESCAPPPSGTGDVSVPFRHGAALIGAAAGLRDELGDIAPEITLDCSQDRTVETTIRESIPDDFGAIEDSVVAQINREVRSVSLLTSQERSVLKNRVSTFNQIIQDQVADEYAYVNPNPLFENNSGQIPDFPNLFDDSTPAFGSLFSLDGIHPSSAAHQLVADAIIDKINNTYGTQLSSVQSP